VYWKNVIVILNSSLYLIIKTILVADQLDAQFLL